MNALLYIIRLRSCPRHNKYRHSLRETTGGFIINIANNFIINNEHFQINNELVTWIHTNSINKLCQKINFYVFFVSCVCLSVYYIRVFICTITVCFSAVHFIRVFFCSLHLASVCLSALKGPPHTESTRHDEVSTPLYTM